MIIAISVQDDWSKLMVGSRFGRSQGFVVVDIDSRQQSLHYNARNRQGAQGDGIQAAQKVARLGVDAVLTGHIGSKAFATLQTAEIDVYTGVQGTVDKAVETFQTGRLQTASEADVEGHC
jgi:predicted Fe-Mo cluster-binding NifX family protein